MAHLGAPRAAAMWEMRIFESFGIEICCIFFVCLCNCSLSSCFAFTVKCINLHRLLEALPFRSLWMTANWNNFIFSCSSPRVQLKSCLRLSSSSLSSREWLIYRSIFVFIHVDSPRCWMRKTNQISSSERFKGVHSCYAHKFSPKKLSEVSFWRSQKLGN